MEHLFFKCPALRTSRATTIKYYEKFDLPVPYNDEDAMRLLLILGLTSSSKSRSKARKIFNVSSEYCCAIWQARNDVLFRYKILGHDAVVTHCTLTVRESHMISSECHLLIIKLSECSKLFSFFLYFQVVCSSFPAFLKRACEGG